MAEGKRLLSLDAFRGATIAAMVLVNDPGSGVAYPQLKHSAWNGWTFTDWVFPFFLFIVGVAMTFSFAKRLEEGANPKSLYWHIIKRTLIIFGLGLVVNGFPFWLDPNFALSNWRIPGVLQRIAICYFVVSIISLHSNIRAQLLWSLVFMTVYWFMVKLIPVPGYGAGWLEPTGNLMWYVDSNLFRGHTYIYAPAPGFDPEGLISTLPAISTTLFGVLTGHWLRSERTKEEKTVWMFVVGNGLLLAGVIFDMWLPINKNMWTTSYTLFMGGWSLICLAIFYWLIDVKGYQRWAKPFVILGMNAIGIYVLSELLATTLWEVHWQSGNASITLHESIFNSLFAPFGNPLNASLYFAVAYVLLMSLVAWGLWRKHLFLKV